MTGRPGRRRLHAVPALASGQAPLTNGAPVRAALHASAEYGRESFLNRGRGLIRRHIPHFFAHYFYFDEPGVSRVQHWPGQRPEVDRPVAEMTPARSSASASRSIAHRSAQNIGCSGSTPSRTPSSAARGSSAAIPSLIICPGQAQIPGAGHQPAGHEHQRVRFQGGARPAGAAGSHRASRNAPAGPSAGPERRSRLYGARSAARTAGG